MSVRFPRTNGTCPCKACQAHLLRGPRERERVKRRKIITHFVEQMERQK